MLYLDSEGDPGVHLRIRHHLEECSPCAMWFGEQHWLEQQIQKSLAAGRETPELWARVLSRARVRNSAVRGRMMVLLATSLIATAAMFWLAIDFGTHPSSSELIRNAVDWHGKWQLGHVQPQLTSHEDIERFLMERFALRCPREGQGGFQVHGVGVRVSGRRQVAFLVGSFRKVPISLIVLDSADPQGEPSQRFRKGDYQAISGIVANHWVIITGKTSVGALQEVLRRFRDLAPDDFPREMK
jgi:hypothetical protein